MCEKTLKMNILAIGNSFSEDAARYLHGVAMADGNAVNIVNLFIGGCSLERHDRNMQSDETAYEWQYNGQKTDRLVSLRDALRALALDVVTLQQASHLSFDKASYEPYLSDLMRFVRQYAPTARILVHQTWAYENGSSRLSEVTPYPTSEAMLADVVRVYGEVFASVFASVGADGIIRSGELLGRLSARGITGLYRDGFHASLGLGRYALGLLWYRTLTGRAVCGNGFRDLDEPVAEEAIMTVQTAVDSFGVSLHTSAV
jgi:hypothetical protein